MLAYADAYIAWLYVGESGVIEVARTSRSLSHTLSLSLSLSVSLSRALAHYFSFALSLSCKKKAFWLLPPRTPCAEMYTS